ncbi:Hypothetical_protein [Hexamita inflata]|uniref:Hypothetical_protein n=1 Tax=Hexamita inflata TaxID=28002 RepID=A0ABP1HDR8_9EUKA
MKACNIYEISVLRLLVNLQDLNISYNNIVYIYPILQVKWIYIVDVTNNMVKDIAILDQLNLGDYLLLLNQERFGNKNLFDVYTQNLSNVYENTDEISTRFDINNPQAEPTQKHLFSANKMMQIDNSTVRLRSMLRSNAKIQAKVNPMIRKVDKLLKEIKFNLVQFTSNIVTLFTQLN